MVNDSLGFAMTARNEAIPEAELDAHEADRRARRERIATAVLVALMPLRPGGGGASRRVVCESTVGEAVAYADALIAELDG